MHSFLGLSNISLCIWTTTSLSIHLSRLLPYPSYCKQCCNEQWDTCVFSILVSLGYMPRSGIAGSYGGFTPRFLLFFFFNLHTVFHIAVSVYIPKNSLHSLFSKPTPAFKFCRFFDDTILTGVRWYLVVVLISISIVMSNVEHVFASHLYVFFGDMSV